jgi:hypothetical protein
MKAGLCGWVLFTGGLLGALDRVAGYRGFYPLLRQASAQKLQRRLIMVGCECRPAHIDGMATDDDYSLSLQHRLLELLCGTTHGFI